MARYLYQKINEKLWETLRKARKYKSNEDWKSYKTLRNKCNKKIKQTKSNHHKKPFYLALYSKISTKNYENF